MSDARTAYWAFNLPLQAWPIEKRGKVVDWRILNYSPRKERVAEFPLSELLTEVEPAEYFRQAATYFDNLARQFRALADGKQEHVYYHDEGMEPAA